MTVTRLAFTRADLTFLPLSIHWRPTEMKSLPHRSGVCVLVVPPAHKGIDFLEMVTQMRDELPQLRLIGGSNGLRADFDYDTIVRSHSPMLAAAHDPNQPRFITVASGATELPRMSLWSDNGVERPSPQTP